MPGSTKRAAAPRAGSPTTSPSTVEGWLHDLGLEPTATVEREGITAWDVALDGRRRRDLRATLILDPAIGAIVWAHLAPPLGDGLRKAYRTLLRWNDEFPLAKFSVADDGRPILAVEIPNRWLRQDELGLALARVALIADSVFDETRGWLWIGGRVPDDYAERPIRTAGLLDRFSRELGELGAPGEAGAPGERDAVGGG
jgi:Putative bacterial sensory transduction regulator